jgi:hypothetical protein
VKSVESVRGYKKGLDEITNMEKNQHNLGLEFEEV